MESQRPRRGGALAAVLIGLAAIAILFVAGTAVIGWYMARHIRVEQGHGRTVVETPFGSVRVREGSHFDPALFGVPEYPGAEQETDGRKLASFDIELGDESHEFTVLAARYTTRDPVEKVAQFYRERLPQWTVLESSGHARRHGGVRFEFKGAGFRRLVAVHEHGGVTRIELASLGEPAAN